MEERFEVNGFDAPSELLQKIENGNVYDLVICDLIMNAMNGLAFIAALRSHSHKIPILMLSGINTAPPIEELKRLGANGFVHKSVDNQILLDAIKTVIAGGSFFADGLEACAINRIDVQTRNSLDEVYDVKPLPKLGARQIEVLRLMANGATNKDISNALTISENTVKSHLKQIFLELGVNKRTACVRKAQTLGLI